MKTTNKSNKHYNRANVMRMAWQIHRKNNTINNIVVSWSDCLKQAWNIEKNGMAVPTIEQIYNKYYKQIFDRVSYKVHNREDAEEITSEVFIRCNKHLSVYDVERAKLSTWLFTIANNLIIDYYRQKKDIAINISQFADAETGKETFQIISDNEANDLIENNELSGSIERAMSNLKPKYRQIAEKFFIEQLNYNEIADLLEMPLGTVKGMINRVRDMLQSELKHEYSQILS